MFPIYGCPNCGKELKMLEDGDYRCKSCKEDFDAAYIESPSGGGIVLQYSDRDLEDDDIDDNEPIIW
jgi:ribosomal protein L37AE/L43A